MIESRWRDTFPIRCSELSKKVKIDKFLDDWPMLTSENGYEYLNLDFLDLNPMNINGLIDRFEATSIIILEKAFQKSKRKFENFNPVKERCQSMYFFS